MKIMKRRLPFQIVNLLAAAGIFLSAGPLRAADPEPATTDQNEDTGYSEIATFAKAVELIRQDYVDGNKVSYHDLIYAAMKGMLSSLDPHSSFMDPGRFQDMQDDTRSRFNGLGIEVAVKDGILTVVTPMEDTPAAEAGILAGDQILKINGSSTEKLGLQDAVEVLRGEPGQKITLTILVLRARRSRTTLSSARRSKWRA
jgi:carboxyl-terminal processing protease